MFLHESQTCPEEYKHQSYTTAAAMAYDCLNREQDRYHSLENRIGCKELRALRPLETVRLCARQKGEEERKETNVTD